MLEIPLEEQFKAGLLSLAALLGGILTINRAFRYFSSDRKDTNKDAAESTLLNGLKARIEYLEEKVQELEDARKTDNHRHRKSQTIALEIYKNTYEKCPFCIKSKELAVKIIEDN